jgi:ElaB/YqjD/DUF883 family membrane-anchored ribosome-binding protein
MIATKKAKEIQGNIEKQLNEIRKKMQKRNEKFSQVVEIIEKNLNKYWKTRINKSNKNYSLKS